MKTYARIGLGLVLVLAGAGAGVFAQEKKEAPSIGQLQLESKLRIKPNWNLNLDTREVWNTPVTDVRSTYTYFDPETRKTYDSVKKAKREVDRKNHLSAFLSAKAVSVVGVTVDYTAKMLGENGDDEKIKTVFSLLLALDVEDNVVAESDFLPPANADFLWVPEKPRK